MMSAAQPPVLAPQNDGAPSSQGGAKKKNKKKKSAAAKTAAAAAATTATTSAAQATTQVPTGDDAPAVSTELDPRNGLDHDAADDASNDGNKKRYATTANNADTLFGTLHVNGHARNEATRNDHAVALGRKQNGADDDGGDSYGDDDDGDSYGGDDNALDSTAPPKTNSNGDLPHSAPEPALAPVLALTSAPAPTPERARARARARTHTSTSPPPTESVDTMTQDGNDGDRSEAEQLRKLVSEVRKAQETQKKEAEKLRIELEESEAGRERAETQYQNLLGRVEKIKETLGDRLKRDKAELEEAKDRVEELETQAEVLRQEARAAESATAAAEAQVKRLQDELDEVERDHERESISLRGLAQLSQQNWQRAKEELARQVQQLRTELESTTGAMGEWEVIAMEERSVRETLTEKAVDLEEQLGTVREQYARVATERDEQGRAIDSLQRALQEIQEARRRELREMVESSEAQLEVMKKRAQEAEEAAEKAVSEADALRRELERTTPFEREVKEKNLLIGKLRHETIVLNDHLTKALRYIKKNKPEENVDRQVVTNHLLQFLALDRSDQKRFQILQVIAGMLSWTDEQKEKAGLARPGTSGNSLRLPTSPFHRTPSTPSLGVEFMSEPTPTGGRESLADLWAGFLERSVEEAASESSNPPSRKGSFT